MVRAMKVGIGSRFLDLSQKTGLRATDATPAPTASVTWKDEVCCEFDLCHGRGTKNVLSYQKCRGRE